MAARGQVLDVALEGNTSISTSELSAAVAGSGLLRSGVAALPQLARTVETLCHEQGFLNAGAIATVVRIAEDSSVLHVRITITEGCRHIVTAVRIAGTPPLPEEALLQDLATRPGGLLSPAALRADAMQLLTRCDEAGHAFATTGINAIHVTERGDSALAVVEFLVDAGDRVTISEVTVQGNDITQPGVITRELRLAPDEAWTPGLPDRLRRRLERLTFFSSVAEPALYQRSTRHGILVRVTEGGANHFDGIVGYQPGRTTDEQGTLTGLVNLSFRNLFGTGRRIDARWERPSSSLTELELRYLEPWVLDWPVNLQGGFFQRFVDSSYVRRAFDARISLMLSESMQVAATVQSVRVIPSSSGPLAAPASTATNAGLELFIDTRDNPWNPFAGIVFRNSWTGGSKTIAGTERIAAGSEFIQRIEIDASVFQETFRSTIIALALHARELRGSRLDLSDLYRLGGALTLRGYREEQFTGTRLVWGNLELRYSLGRRSYAFVFLDAGHIFQEEDASQDRTGMQVFRHGYGVGGRLETPLGVLAVSYALGQGDSFTTAKIHFGLINEF